MIENECVRSWKRARSRVHSAMTATIVVLLPILIAELSSSGNLNADIVSVEFSGTTRTLFGDPFGLGIALNDSFEGSMIYDTAASSSAGPTGSSRYAGQYSSLRLSFGSNSLQFTQNGDLLVFNDFGGVDLIRNDNFLNVPFTGAANGIAAFGTFILQDNDASAFDDQTLPLSLTGGDFESAHVGISITSNSSIFWGGEITSLSSSSVPEPTTGIALLGIAVGMVVTRRSRPGRQGRLR